MNHTTWTIVLTGLIVLGFLSIPVLIYLAATILSVVATGFLGIFLPWAIVCSRMGILRPEMNWFRSEGYCLPITLLNDGPAGVRKKIHELTGPERYKYDTYS